MGVEDLFSQAIEVLLKNEGGYVYHPSDPGGQTKYGISKNRYPYLDIMSLTRDQAIEIYRKDYWVNEPYQHIKDPRLAIKAFEMAVNMGQTQADKLLQSAVCDFGVSLVIDGNIGPKSLEAINKLNPVALLSVFQSKLCKFYIGLVSSENDKDRAFLLGWLRRVYS